MKVHSHVCNIKKSLKKPRRSAKMDGDQKVDGHRDVIGEAIFLIF